MYACLRAQCLQLCDYSGKGGANICACADAVDKIITVNRY